MQSIAVLIPCYNDAKTIKKVVEDWKRELPEAKIYVYDNNSTDGTAKIAEDAGAVVRYERLQGKGNVVRRMFQEIEAEMTIHAVDKNMSFVNKTVPFRNRPEGSVSSMNTIVDGIKVIKTILHLFCDYRPFVFFSLIAACLSILSLIFFIPVLNEYFQTGLVPRFPTLIICGFAMIAAINLFIAGIILQTIKHKERREFEFRLQTISQWRKDS